MATKKARQSNIELLRIITMLGIIVLHFNHPDMGGGFARVQVQSINGIALYLYEALFCCGVDLFVMITGYFMAGRERIMISKAVDLILQVMIYSAGGYLLMVIAAGRVFSLRDFAASFVPNNYFVILYVALFLTIPFINVLIRHLSVRQMRQLLIVLVLIFGLWPLAADVLEQRTGMIFSGLSTIGLEGDQAGYTIVTFLICYFFGAYVGRTKRKSVKSNIAGYLICTLIIAVWAYAGAYIGVTVSALHYNNPVVILQGFFLLRAFLQLDLGSVSMLNRLSDGSFGVFLLHSAFLTFLPTERIVSSNVLIMTAEILICVVVIYLICWAATYVYQKLYGLTIGKLIQNICPYTIEVTHEET